MVRTTCGLCRSCHKLFSAPAAVERYGKMHDGPIGEESEWCIAVFRSANPNGARQSESASMNFPPRVYGTSGSKLSDAKVNIIHEVCVIH